MLSVTRVALSHHKKSLPEDSDSCDDIGLSSEEEAEDLKDVPYIRRKFQARQKTKTTERKDTSNSGTMTSPRRSPRLSTPSATVTTDQPSTSTTTGPSTVVAGGMATVAVPVEALKQVRTAIDNIIAGLPVPPQQSTGATVSASQGSATMPFDIVPPKTGDKLCTVCQRTFHNTTALRRHQTTHTGKQDFICPNAGCKRKLSSRISYDKHMTTCKVAKTFKCGTANCGKIFATKAALNAHSIIHLQLVGPAAYCPCGKGPFSIPKYKKDHFTTCDANPNKKGPFPCPFANFKRGPGNPFRRIRNLNTHLKDVHGYDAKHGI